MRDMARKTNNQSAGIGCEEIFDLRAEGVEQPNSEDFEGIYRQYHERVYSLCLRRAGDERQALCLMKKAFLHVFRRLGTFRGVSDFYQTYAQPPRVADCVADWICRQSDQY